MLSAVPTIVCGREKRHSTPRARAAAAGRGPAPARGTCRGVLRRASGGRRTHVDRTRRCGRTRATMLASYRRTGADPPFGDPAGYHGVAMEGHFWRITRASSGTVVIAIVAVCRDARGAPWAMASLAAHP